MCDQHTHYENQKLIKVVDAESSIGFNDRVDTEIFYKEFGRRVAARRASARLTQLDVAARSGMSRATIASIESGRQRVQLHQLYALARGLKLADIGDILPTEVSAAEEIDLLPAIDDVSALQRAQIDSIMRTALASARSRKGNK